MNFSTNYDDLNDFDLLPPGKYETIIKSAEEATTKNGTPYIDVRLVIRNDIEQAFKDRYIFHKIWKKKEPSQQDSQVDGYSFKQLMNLANSSKIPAGKNYGSIAELLADFSGKCVLTEIEHDTYNNNTHERVKFFEPTAHPDCKHVFKERSQPAAANTYKPQQNDVFAQPPVKADLADFEEIITEGDLPF